MLALYNKLSVARLQVLLLVLNALLLFGLDWSSEAIFTADSNTYLIDTGQRPWFIQFIYSDLLEGKYGAIVLFQKVFHVISVAVLAYTCSRIATKKFLKIALLFLIYGITGWWNVVGWTHVLLSESLCFSFLAFTMSSLFLIFLSKHDYLWMTLFCIGVVLISGIRDHFHIIFLCLSVISLVYAFVFSKKKILFFVFATILFSAQSFVVSNAIKDNARHTLVTANIVQMRLLLIPEAKDYLIHHGMPTPKELDTLIGQPSWAFDAYLFTNENLKDYLNWIRNFGLETYQSYLISHPQYLLTSPFKDREVYRLDAPTAYPNYPSNVVFLFLTILQPLFNFKTTLLLLIIGVFYKRSDPKLLFMPCVFLCFGILEFYISYHADTREISRHLIRVSPLFQLSAVTSIVLILDHYLASKQEDPNVLSSKIPT